MERYEPKNILGGALSGRLAVERRYSLLAKHYNPDNTLVTSVMKNLERNHALALLESSKMQNTLASLKERYKPKNMLGGALSEKLAVKHRYSSLAKHYNPATLVAPTTKAMAIVDHTLPLFGNNKTQSTFASFRERYKPKNMLGGALSEKLAVKHRYSSLAKHYNPDNTLVMSVMKNLERNHALALLESSKMQNTLASFRERGNSDTSCQNVLWGVMRNRRESPVRRIRQKPNYARKAHEIPRLISQETEVVQDELIACYQNILKETEDVMVRYRYFIEIENAIKCYEQEIYPEAITALWKAAVRLLYEYVLFRYPREFNDVAREKVRKWKEAKTIDDLGKMNDSVFLDCLQAISVISPTVKKQLKICLVLRNLHAHPTSAEITPLAIAYYFETLLINVFNQFQYTEDPEITVH